MNKGAALITIERLKFDQWKDAQVLDGGIGEEVIDGR